MAARRSRVTSVNTVMSIFTSAWNQSLCLPHAAPLGAHGLLQAALVTEGKAKGGDMCSFQPSSASIFPCGPEQDTLPS